MELDDIKDSVEEQLPEIRIASRNGPAAESQRWRNGLLHPPPRTPLWLLSMPGMARGKVIAATGLFARPSFDETEARGVGHILVKVVKDVAGQVAS